MQNSYTDYNGIHWILKQPLIFSKSKQKYTAATFPTFT